MRSAGPKPRGPCSSPPPASCRQRAAPCDDFESLPCAPQRETRELRPWPALPSNLSPSAPLGIFLLLLVVLHPRSLNEFPWLEAYRSDAASASTFSHSARTPSSAAKGLWVCTKHKVGKLRPRLAKLWVVTCATVCDASSAASAFRSAHWVSPAPRALQGVAEVAMDDY
jgi:hypothetical protein